MRKLTAILLALLATSAAQAQEQPSAEAMGKLLNLAARENTLQERRGIPETIVFDAPTEAPVGELIVINVTGIPNDSLSNIALKWFPRGNVFVLSAYTWGGQPFILFQANTAGEYLLYAIMDPANGDASYGEAVITIGDPSPPVPPPVPPTPTDDIAIYCKGMAEAQVTGETRQQEAKALAAAYDKINERIQASSDAVPPVGVKPISTRQEGLKEFSQASKKVLGDRFSAWESCLTSILNQLDSLEENGEIAKTVFGMGEAFSKVADGLEAAWND